MKARFSLLLIFVLLFCSKNPEVTQESKYLISGITETNDSGIVISEDPDDWKYINFNGLIIDTSTPPCTSESASYKSSVVLGICPGRNEYPNAFGFVPAFPNPTSDSVCIVFKVGGEHLFGKILIMNSDSSEVKNIFTDTLLIGTHIMKWDLLNNSGIKLPIGLYRCYAFISYKNETKSVYGDIQIK